MRTILFICQANVGRSQMAEGFYNAYAKQSRAISAGIEDFREKYHGHPAPEIVAVMAEEGIDISQQKVKQLTTAMLGQVDSIVVLCKKEQLPPDFPESGSVKFVEIEDPYEQGIKKVRQIRDTVKHIVREFIAKEEVIA